MKYGPVLKNACLIRSFRKYIHFTIEQGQSLAFMGQNGCGKSTLLKIIAGLVRTTKGCVCLEKGKVIHYVPEHFPKMNLTARRYLSYMGKMDNLEDAALETCLHELAEEFFVSNMLDIPMKYLSKGSLQKIGVIQALLKEPDILLLDEPLSGQDVMSQQVFIQKIQELQKHHVTILMSCHELYLVDAIADEVYRFADGKIVLESHKPAGEAQWYHMFFVRTEKADIPEKWKGHLQFTEQVCVLRVAESECDRAMMEMLGMRENIISDRFCSQGFLVLQSQCSPFAIRFCFIIGIIKCCLHEIYRHRIS